MAMTTVGALYPDTPDTCRHVMTVSKCVPPPWDLHLTHCIQTWGPEFRPQNMSIKTTVSKSVGTYGAPWAHFDLHWISMGSLLDFYWISSGSFGFLLDLYWISIGFLLHLYWISIAFGHMH